MLRVNKANVKSVLNTLSHTVSLIIYLMLKKRAKIYVDIITN